MMVMGKLVMGKMVMGKMVMGKMVMGKMGKAIHLIPIEEKLVIFEVLLADL
jgi:hypothetical protein